METRLNIAKVKVNSLDELLHFMNTSFVAWPNLVFRGHAESSWLLESTLSRALKKITLTQKDSLVENHLQKFSLEIRGRRGSNPRQLNENETWALGQHFGLYTPLLDWSQSPYVALFFALTSLQRSPTGLRTLWGLNSTDVITITDWYSNNKPNDAKWAVDLINPSLDENSRLVNQRGLFTKLHVENDIENWVANGPYLKWVSLYKIDFPDEIRDVALSYLDLMNINYSSLFPDLFGSSLHSNIKLEQTDHITQQQLDAWAEYNNGIK